MMNSLKENLENNSQSFVKYTSYCVVFPELLCSINSNNYRDKNKLTSISLEGKKREKVPFKPTAISQFSLQIQKFFQNLQDLGSFWQVT